MSLSPFTLADGSYVLGDNGNTSGGKAEMVIAENKDNEAKVTEIARVRDNGNAVTVKNMAPGGKRKRSCRFKKRHPFVPDNIGQR